MSKKKAAPAKTPTSDESKDTVRLSPDEIAKLLREQGVEPDGDLSGEFPSHDDEE